MGGGCIPGELICAGNDDNSERTAGLNRFGLVSALATILSSVYFGECQCNVWVVVDVVLETMAVSHPGR